MRERLFLFIGVSDYEDCDDENEFDGDFGVIDEFPFGGISGVEGVADADEADAGDEGEKGGVGDS